MTSTEVDDLEAVTDVAVPPATGRPRSRTPGPPPVGRSERIGLLAGVVALAAVVIGTRFGVFTPDTRPDLYQQPGRFLASSLDAWVGGANGLGQANFNAGAAPIAAVVWVIRGLGASPWLAVRIWRLLLLVVGAWGIRRYLAALLGSRLTVAGRVVATVFWVVNPYAVVSASTTPILLPYALLPWTLLAFVQATRQPRSWRWPAAFALGFFAQSGLNAGVVPFFQLLAVPAHLVHARWIERHRWRDLVRVLVRCGLLAVVVSLYWLLPSFLASSTGAGIAGSTEDPRDIARTSSYGETGRLLGNWPLYGRGGARLFLGDYAIYLTNPLVVAASFAVPLAVGISLWRSRARERLLTVALLAVGLPVMVGLFPPDHPYAAGRLLGAVFDRVPVALAFRTTNKVGAIVVLAYVIALAVGVGAWRHSGVARSRRVRVGATAVAAALLLAASAPLWDGGLYPLGFRFPRTWQDATADLDRTGPDGRVLVVPGGAGGNYRWGMRSPDDVFPSLLERPAAVRTTVVGRGDPAGNFMSGFDTALAEGALPARGLSVVAHYLGATDVLVRNDLLTEEINGPSPAAVTGLARDDPGLVLRRSYGKPGTDTVPDTAGPVTERSRQTDRSDSAVAPLLTLAVTDADRAVHIAPASQQILVDGDGGSVIPLARDAITDGRRPIRLLGSLDQRSFATSVRDGGRLVLTDTNRRRAWDVNRVANATSATLAANGDVDSGNGATTTLWPDDPTKQTVTEVTGVASVTADKPGFGLHPFGRASNAFDGDPTTAWITGGFSTATGNRIGIALNRTRTVRSVSVQALPSEPSRITSVAVQVGASQVVQALPPDGTEVKIPIRPTPAERVVVTILGQTPGLNPVGISSVTVDDVAVREVTRLPETLSRLTSHADATTRRRLASMPLDVVLTRAEGIRSDQSDDEEAQLDRRFRLPDDRTMVFTAELTSQGADPVAVAAARRGDRSCRRVALLDGRPLRARVVSTPGQVAEGRLLLQGCGDQKMASGGHELLTIFGWRLDQVRFSSGGAEGASGRSSGASGPSLRLGARTPTRIEASVAASGPGARLFRLGEAFDERWALSIDGRDAGPPILVDGYATGWRIDEHAHRLVATFTAQRAVKATFLLSLAGVVGVVAVVVLPAPSAEDRRRWRHRARHTSLTDGVDQR